jgi:hypothetical protein
LPQELEWSDDVPHDHADGNEPVRQAARIRQNAISFRENPKAQGFRSNSWRGVGRAPRGELPHEFVLAMNAGVGPGKIASMIHAYPLLLNSRPKPATNGTWPA